MAHATRYRQTIDDVVIQGERIPAWLTLTFTEDDGTTPKDVSGHEFAASAVGGAGVIAITPDMTDAATGKVVFPLDTSAAAVGVYAWDVVDVQGATPATNPIDISVGGTLTVQARVTEVPS